MRDYSEEKTVYILGVVLMICFLVFLLILNFLNINILEFNIPCVIYEKTGIYCPGCGMTRAVKALLNGNIIASIKYHPLVVYFAIIYGLFMIVNTISLIVKKEFIMKINNTLLLLIPIILFLEWGIKNILLIFFDIRII